MYWPIVERDDGAEISTVNGFMTYDEAIEKIEKWKAEFGKDRIGKQYIQETDNRDGWVLRTIEVN